MPIQSVLHPAGIEAVRVSYLWWTIFTICAVVWVLVAVAALVAIQKGRRAAAAGARESTLHRNIAVASGVSVAALIFILCGSVVTGRALNSLRTADALRIQVTGYQWWWDVQYELADPSLRVETANEIHIPVGRPVAIDLLSADVIHSLWIPNLEGKIDLVPGRLNQLWLRADRPGVFRAQCAEFCGLQHAHMALMVVVDEPDAFERWLTANRASAVQPSTPAEQHGEQVFERGPCAMCHNVTGTSAGGRTAPDLTHIASRSTIGAGTLPTVPAIWPAGLPTRSTSSPATTCPLQG